MDTREQSVIPVDEAVCSASTLCPYVVAKEVLLITPRDFMEIVTALAETSMENFMLDLADDYEDNVPDTPTMVADGGVLLNAIFRGCLSCTVPGQNPSYRPPIVSRKYDLSSSKVSDGVYTAICSAVAELPPETQLKSLGFYLVDSDRWGWLVYTLCCGSLTFNLKSLRILHAILTREDVVAMREVLRNQYPVVSSEQRTLRLPQYGFVSIQAGADLVSTRLAEGESMVLRSTSIYRCRARYCVNSPAWAEVIVRGCGICKTRVGEGASSFDRDSLEFGRRNTQHCHLSSLNLQIGKIELDTLVLDLLVFIGAGLRTLSMMIDESDPYLENPMMRMARELVELKISSTHYVEFDADKRRKLDAHDGDFLPLTKEKVPLTAKVAMLSIVSGKHSADQTSTKSRAVSHLDAML